MRPAPLVQRRRSAATPPLNALTAPAFDGYKADVWALCVTLWTLLTGQVPFGASASNPMDLFAAIEHDPLPPKPPCMSDGAYAFFRAGLTKADGERPSMRGLLVRALRPLFSRRLRPSHLTANRRSMRGSVQAACQSASHGRPWRLLRCHHSKAQKWRS